MKTFVTYLGAVLLAFAAAGLAPAMAGPSATGRPVLTVDGSISQAAPNRLSIADLEQMERMSFTTTTPWHDGPVTFEGVPLRALMQRLGASGSTVLVVALNKYATEIPLSDFEMFDAILAYKLNGEYMSVREKGPLFIVYPYDSDPNLRNDKYFTRSAWQVATMTVR